MKKVFMVMLLAIIPLSTCSVFYVYHSSKDNVSLAVEDHLRLTYDVCCSIVEYEPGKDLEFRNPDATLSVELTRVRDRYVLDFTVDIKGYALYPDSKSITYKEFKRNAVLEYDRTTKRFYWQGKDVGALLPMFQPLEDRIILFSAEFIPLGAELKISSYPPSSLVWASKNFTTKVYLEEGKVFIPELNRTWWLKEIKVRPPIWDMYEALSKIANSNTLEITHYRNDTTFGFLGASIERNTGIITYMSMPGPCRTFENSKIIVNGEPISEIPVTLLPYLLGLRNIITLNLIDIE